MKKLALAVSAAALLAVPAAPAAAAGPDIPEINCGIVSCTYKVEQALETGAGIVEDVANCATGTVRVVQNYLNGIVGMYYCDLG
jgi:acid phosphatase class B